MKVLLLYPEDPVTFWSFKYALKFISRKAAYPPLGLLTVAAMLPEKWDVKLLDMNVRKLRDRDLKWADCVFVSAMMVQSESVKDILQRCKSLGCKVIAGGPLFTTGYEEFVDMVDHFVLGEAEHTLPRFIEDLKRERAGKIYRPDGWVDLATSPVPRRDLVNTRHYGAMNIQYSRGCPFDCEFCNITSLFGRAVRTKTREQIIAELDNIHALKWKGCVFIVDDNFIGNKGKLKKEILPAMIEWMEERNHPFTFSTEASINLADDEELMELMVRAGFDTIFVGIETPNQESLEECGKRHNKNRDMIASIKKMQHYGLEVQGGFIVGFDNDTSTIFDRMINFVQESSIPTAMVGLLNALPDTKLYNRLMKEGRLFDRASGNNTDFSINFAPSMDLQKLVDGYKRVMQTIYSPKFYYKRSKGLLQNLSSKQKKLFHIRYNYIMALFKSILHIGILGRERFHYWRFFFYSLFRHPRRFPYAITLTIYGYHFRRMVKKLLRARKLPQNL
jgi:radical SAM superfamily enzyme YgiQ (UPF0313 family)